MIFVTVGTHEQPFNRVLRKIDELIEKRIITERVIVQSGFSNYSSNFFEIHKFLSMDEMEKYIKQARIIITHGGPASFIAVLQQNKIPIVIPRQKKYNEHINDHQVSFVKFISQKKDNIIPIYNIDKLGCALIHYDEISKRKSQNINSNNESFNKQLSDIIDKLLEK